MSRTFLWAALCLLTVSAGVSQETTDKTEGRQSRDALKEPVFRISKARLDANIPAKAAIIPANPIIPANIPAKAEIGPALTDPIAAHPLDPAIAMAKQGLANIQANIQDYSCTLVKQERINGELLPQEYMYMEVRNHREQDRKLVTPFSVYMFFLKPDTMKGREVIYVEGQNDGNLVAHEGGGLLRRIGAVKLKPEGPIAMRGNRYPITQVGIEFLISELIKKGERDRAHGECTVEFKEGVKINGRGCTMLEVTHPHPRPWFDFHIARVFIDDELNLPLRYEAYTWPTAAGSQPVLEECYTYLNMKVNIGLKDDNFDPKRFRL